MSEKSKKRNMILTVSSLLVIAAATAVLVIFFLNMQSRPRTGNADLSADEVVTGVIKKMNYQNLTPISKENISRYYEIPEDTVCDYAMYISGRTGSETELTCFKLKDGGSEDALMDNINDYLSTKSSMTSVPSDAVSTQNTPQANASAVMVRYPFIFVAVAQDSSNALKAFDVLVTELPKEDSSLSSKHKPDLEAIVKETAAP